MNENVLTIILCVIASVLAVILCNYNKCKYHFKMCCNKKQQGITIDEMKIIIDDMDEFENNKHNKHNKNPDENELL
jgi:hypothetical protein